MIDHRFFLEDKRSLRILILGNRELSDYTSTPEYILGKVSHFSQIPEDRIYLLDQVHGKSIVNADSLKSAEISQGDALYSAEPRKVLVVKTADCMPIFFWTGRPALVGIVHSGWKGTLAGVTESALLEVSKKYGVDLQLLQFFIGPYATGKQYEVGEDVAGEFRKEFPGALKELPEEGKFLLEQKVFLMNRIRKLGTEPFVETSGACTMAANSRYFSHRRGDTGRNLNCIWLE
ncbi:YfiH family protein [Leptospira fainei serovar Hurstbridge str. BUT 6]|uniref:YfiH family protein n=1 Tax=Leptospira fainei serovar Hurstbridge str. BUT 6 TaxID=1193011 RepID=S3V3L6_9LEPT|nr:YfiH family protein [Leptospira fainei serovar Hurstbridge str. BUT 6]